MHTYDSYDYFEALRTDIFDALIEDSYLLEGVTAESLCDDPDEVIDRLTDEFWMFDSITGNASGSYTFNAWKAQEYVMQNTDALRQALEDFCIEPETIAEKFLNEEWEYFDVTIRCSLLSLAVNDVICEIISAIRNIKDAEPESAEIALRLAA